VAASQYKAAAQVEKNLLVNHSASNPRLSLATGSYLAVILQR
jgi:hypothetical protein